MKQLTILCTALLLLNASSCQQSSTNNCLPVTTDQSANLDQFLGLWYEIGNMKQFFNRGCSCTTAEYSLSDTPGRITVNNSCERLLFGDIEGFAYAPDINDFSKLKVSFPSFPGGEGDYWILYFDGVNGQMLVGNPDKDNLYILSKTSTISDNDYDGLLAIAEDMCFDISKFSKTDQSDCDR